jgi:broad specificity phosphatase PhoE
LLIRSYDLGDMSVVYPLARGTARPLTTAGAFIALDERLSVAHVFAVALISLGIIVVSIRSGAGRAAVGFACATGVSVAGYSLFGGLGVRTAGTVLGFQASPQPRALRTAELIRECLGVGGIAISTDDRLCEVSTGRWEGLKQEEIERLAPSTFDNELRYEWCFNAPGGESYDGFSALLADWFEEVAGDSPLLVVTHGVVARVLRGFYAGIPQMQALALPVPEDRIFRLSCNAIEEITIDAGRKMVRPQAIVPLPAYRVFVEFDDAVAGTLQVELSKVFLDEAEFRRVAIDDFGAVCWPAGQALPAKRAYEVLCHS